MFVGILVQWQGASRGDGQARTDKDARRMREEAEQ